MQGRCRGAAVVVDSNMTKLVIMVPQIPTMGLAALVYEALQYSLQISSLQQLLRSFWQNSGGGLISLPWMRCLWQLKISSCECARHRDHWRCNHCVCNVSLNHYTIARTVQDTFQYSLTGTPLVVNELCLALDGFSDGQHAMHTSVLSSDMLQSLLP